MKKGTKCFISYSQKDFSFVNNLIMDLHYCDIDVTYDRIELKVGDSIIEKISHIINTTMIIIPIISKNSINSNWVSKELSLSLTAEISSQTKVFPVKIDETEMPYSLGDKLYADFFRNYYYGLRDLVRSINPDFYRANRRKNQKNYFFKIDSEFNFRNKIQKNKEILLREFGSHWFVSEILGGTKLGTLSIDNIVINGQSHCYEIDLIFFGDLNLYNRDAYFEERVRKLSIFYKQLNKNENLLDELFKTIILNLKSQYASEQLIYRKLSVENITVNFITGRRNEYTEKFNYVRTKFLKQTNGHVKIMSYDRVINSINSIK